MKKCIDKLKFIASLKNPELRRKILLSINDDCLYYALNEIAINTVNGNIKLKSHEKRRLTKYKSLIKKLSNKTNNRKQRKKLVLQSGGFLPILIPAVASIITSLISR